MSETEEDFVRVPGFYGAWDVAQLLEPGRSYRVEDGGRTDDGQALFMVFQLQPNGACGD